MGRPRNRPAEFPTDWHWEAHLDGLTRELAGYEARIGEAEALDKDDPFRARNIAFWESARDATLEQMKHYGIGPEKASKRPKAAAVPKKETRTK